MKSFFFITTRLLAYFIHLLWAFWRIGFEKGSGQIAWIILLTYLLVSSQAYAQSRRSEWRFDHLTVNNGLSHSDATAVAQDQAGFIWIGTNKGLNRYDGSQLKYYFFHVGDSFSLSDNRIYSLYVSPSDELWVGTENGGLNYYDRPKDRFVRMDETLVPKAYQATMQILSQAYVTGIASDGLGQLWVGTQTKGLFILQRDASGKFLSVRRARLANNNRYQFGVSALQTDANGDVWIGTTSDGLFRIKPHLASLSWEGTFPLANPLFTAQSVDALHLDRQRNLWIGVEGKLFFIPQPQSDTSNQPVAQPVQPDSTFPEIVSLFLDSFKRLWVGTRYGLYILSEAPVTSPHPPSIPFRAALVERVLPRTGSPSSLSSNRIHQIIEDRFQVIWIATSSGGMNKTDLLAKPFAHLQQQGNLGTSLPNSYINAIYKEEDRNLLWIATRNGFSKYNLTDQTYENYLSQQLEGNATGIEVNTIFQDSQGTLWFGTWSDGFTALRRQGKQEQVERYSIQSGKQGPGSEAVLAFAEDRRGYLWVGTFYSGISQYTRQGQYLKTYTTRNSALPTDRFTYLYYDPPTDVLWASTQDAGLLKLRVTEDSLMVLKHFKPNPDDSLSISVKYVWPILKDSRGNLWVGTLGGGLHQVVRDSTGTERVVRYGKWLPESDVESILEDGQGNLWVGGAGLFRFNPRTRQYLRFNVDDGLQSNSFKVGAATRAKDGTMYFGGVNGISYFLPQLIRTNPYPPNVMLTELRIFNKPVLIDEEINGRVVLDKNISMTREITIQASENDFSLEFVALHYANPDKQTYAYQLEGYHKDWIYPAAGQRTANFTNLESGSYTFRVKASNGDGLWSEKPALLRIQVLPPWWRTWWAYILYLLFISAMLLVARRIRVAQQELKNKLALEKRQHEQDQEMNTLKLRFFTNVSHELRTPLTLILGPMEELITLVGRSHGLRDKALMMHRQARKLLDLVNQLMDFRKAESEQLSLIASEGNLVAFVQEIFLIFQPKAQEKQIDYSFVADPPELRLYFDHQKMEIALTNLLSNAFKYSQERGKIQACVSVVGDPSGLAQYRDGRLHNNYLQIQIRDWGVGIPANELDKIFDLYYQATHTETLQVIGTGIGLSLVKQIVLRHSGEIKVESQVGQGTQFTLLLPLGKQHLKPDEIQLISPEEKMIDWSGQAYLAPTDAEEPVFSTEGASLSTCKLLIVEDNEEVREYLKQLFDPIMTVEVAANGLEGWEKTMDSLPDLVISDIMMPLSDGLELCGKIKQHPKTMHIPVVLLTARVAPVHELEGLEMRADDYVMKPFHPKLLQAKIVNMLHNRQKLQEFYHRQILLQPTDLVIPDEDRTLLETAMKIVESNLENPDFTVQILFKEIGMSQSVFYRRLKSITGQSALEFIQDIRMKRAAQLLRESSMRVSEIAFKVGIEDIKYFRKVFQKLYHLSPTEYAKQNRSTIIHG